MRMDSQMLSSRSSSTSCSTSISMHNCETDSGKIDGDEQERQMLSSRSSMCVRETAVDIASAERFVRGSIDSSMFSSIVS